MCRGVFVRPEVVGGVGPAADRRRLAATTAAAVLATPGAVASHASAAVLADLPVWRLPKRPCITLPPGRTGDASVAHLHRAGMLDRHRRPAGALIRTSADRAVCDLAREHGIEDAVVVADAALRRGMVVPEGLDRCLVECARWPGIRRARAAIERVDGRSESPLETVSRLRLADVGTPHPHLQPELFTTYGEWLGRVDFYWDEYGVVGEVDGKVKYTEAPDPDVLWDEKLRQERLEDAGLIVVRWGRAQLRDLHRLTERLHNAFARGARRSRADRGWAANPATLPHESTLSGPGSVLSRSKVEEAGTA